MTFAFGALGGDHSKPLNSSSSGWERVTWWEVFGTAVDISGIDHGEQLPFGNVMRTAARELLPLQVSVEAAVRHTRGGGDGRGGCHWTGREGGQGVGGGGGRGGGRDTELSGRRRGLGFTRYRGFDFVDTQVQMTACAWFDSHVR